MFKETQKKMVNVAEQFLRKSGLSDKIICKILRTLHTGIFFLIIFALLFAPEPIFFLTVLCTLSIYTSFLIFNACLFTKLEYRFAKDNFNVIDPLLIIVKKECNNKNRYNVTIVLNVLVGVSMPILYYLRFAN